MCNPLGICSSVPFVPGGDAPVETDAPIAPPDGPNPDTPAVPPMLSFGERNGSLNDTFFDTFLDSGSPADNMGTHADLHLVAADDGPILLRIDVSAIPSYATITAARLKLRVTAATIPDGTTIELFAMNESWTEGTDSYEPGIANYTERDTNMAWSTSGARPPARGTDAVATRTFAATVATGGDFEIELPAALVTSWVTTPGANHGLAMIVSANDFYCELGSSEAGASNARPVLEVELE